MSNLSFNIKEFTAPIASKDHQGQPWVDPFSPKLLLLLNVLSTRLVDYDGSPLTTWCHKALGSMDMVWVVLLCNGAVHPHQIKRGPVAIPTVESLQRMMEGLQPESLVGQVREV